MNYLGCLGARNVISYNTRPDSLKGHGVYSENGRIRFCGPHAYLFMLGTSDMSVKRVCILIIFLVFVLSTTL